MLSCTILVAFFAMTTSLTVLGDECPTRFPRKMKPLWLCCKLETNGDTIPPPEERQARISACYNGLDGTKFDLKAAPDGYDCIEECFNIKLGIMGTDKVINKEKLLNATLEMTHKDFHEVATKAFETCMGKKYNTRCPSGIDGIMECQLIQLLLNCPAKHWADGEDCKETKKLMERCADTIGLFGHDDEDN